MSEFFNHKNFIGFDSFIESLQGINNKTNYPPYNIFKWDELNHQVEVAVAGFTREELTVTVDNNRIIITGEHQYKHDASNIIYHGISGRGFKISFGITDDCVVENVKLNNGILSLDIKKIIPDEKAPKVIDIQ